ncbi:hypothetical protein FGG08_005387 [Glutinoglossum americanum]|uniref:Uncharacterized protein n=1 Tax=Glutinoglossum americanum TaxID=1670608 RepID=A0A9P8I330_9PEZI|nr:hypothetical protein FGG08_005387 [Glutinoglossum americanum]
MQRIGISDRHGTCLESFCGGVVNIVDTCILYLQPMFSKRKQASATRLPALGWSKTHSTEWHRKIEPAMVQHKALNVGQDSMQYFPLYLLRDLTDDYLRKKSTNLTSDETDTRLAGLVKVHPAKDVAIVAYTHTLSAKAVRDLLCGELQVDLGCHTGLLTFLQVTVAISLLNTDAVKPLEAQCTQTLIRLSSLDVLTVGRDLIMYFTLLAANSRTNLLLHPSIDAIPHNACTNLAAQLEAMRLDKRWQRAHAASEWLTKLSRTSRIIEGPLDASFLELEGPDFISGGRATLREGLMPQRNFRSGFSIRYGQFLIRLENDSKSNAHGILDRLLEILDRAQLVSTSAVSLFTHMCVRNTADDKALQTLELLIETGNPSDLSGLPSCQSLQNTLSSRVVNTIQETMLKMQDKFCEQLQGGWSGDGSGTKLHVFGQSLLDASWVQPMLSEGIRSLLSRWPQAEDVSALFSLWSGAQGTSLKASSELIEMIDAYCISCLAGCDSVSEETGNIIDGLINLWRRPPDSKRRTAALAIATRFTIPFPILRRCLVELYDMSDKFVHEVSLIVSKDTDMACVNFARLLASQRLANTARIGCWRDLLQYMIEQHSSTLVDYTLTNFGVEPWLKWLDGLRKIFGDGIHSSLPILGGPFFRWTERLSTNYLAILTSFEKSVGAPRWILMGWEESETIIPFLDPPGKPDKGPYQPATEFMVALLAPDGSNSKQICRALALLTRTTAHGTRACLRMLEVHQKPPKQITEVLLAGWLQSAEMTRRDILALKEMATTLDIKVHVDNNPLRASSQAASDFLDNEYCTILEEAVRLESIRLTLKAHDVQRTSRLLASLSIEDPSTIEDAVSGTVMRNKSEPL